jgi:hypothetical protein
VIHGVLLFSSAGLITGIVILYLFMRANTLITHYSPLTVHISHFTPPIWYFFCYFTIQITIMIKLFFIICSLAVLATACKKKDDTPAGFTWPDGTGDYAPYTNGSTFVYEVNNSAPASVDSFTYTVTKDTTIDGLKYRKLESNKPLIATTLYCNYNNGVRTEITYNSTFSGLNIPIIKQTVLKVNEAQGVQWNEILSVNVSGFSVPVTFTYNNVQKGITKNVLSKDYANTIFTKQVATIPNLPILPPGTPTSITIDNYFAKDFGLVQRDAPNIVYKLKRANVVK